MMKTVYGSQVRHVGPMQADTLARRAANMYVGPVVIKTRPDRPLDILLQPTKRTQWVKGGGGGRGANLRFPNHSAMGEA